MLNSIEPNRHNKAEWLRFAESALLAGKVQTARVFSAAANSANGAKLSIAVFDNLQAVYRAWLVFGTMPAR